MGIPWCGIQFSEELTVRVHAGVGLVDEEGFLPALIAILGILIWRRIRVVLHLVDVYLGLNIGAIHNREPIGDKPPSLWQSLQSD